MQYKYKKAREKRGKNVHVKRVQCGKIRGVQNIRCNLLKFFYCRNRLSYFRSAKPMPPWKSLPCYGNPRLLINQENEIDFINFSFFSNLLTIWIEFHFQVGLFDFLFRIMAINLENVVKIVAAKNLLFEHVDTGQQGPKSWK